MGVTLCLDINSLNRFGPVTSMTLVANDMPLVLALVTVAVPNALV